MVTLTLGGSEATTKEEDLILILQRILKDSLIYLSMLPFSYKTLELVANERSAKRTKSEIINRWLTIMAGHKKVSTNPLDLFQLP